MDIWSRKKGGASKSELLAAIAAKRAGQGSSAAGASSGSFRTAEVRGHAYVDDEARPAEPADSSASQSEGCSAAPSSESSGAFESADDRLQSDESEQPSGVEEDEVTSGAKFFNDAIGKGSSAAGASSGAFRTAEVRGHAYGDDEAGPAKPADSCAPHSEVRSAAPSSDSSGAFDSAADRLQSHGSEQPSGVEDDTVPSGAQFFNDASSELPGPIRDADDGKSCPVNESVRANSAYSQARGGSTIYTVDMDMEAPVPRPSKPQKLKDERQEKAPGHRPQKPVPQPVQKLVAYSRSSETGGSGVSQSSITEITSRLAGTTLEPPGFDATHRIEKVVLNDWVLDGGLAVPDYVHADLYPHQKEGVAFLWRLHQANKGGILGDDMGLGKTRQIASFLAGLFHTRLVKTVLLVVPNTLLPQWHVELASVRIRDCLEYSSGVSVAKRAGVLEDLKQRPKGGVLITTYEMVKVIGAGMSWDYLILDEGHLAKNCKTQRFIELKNLKVQHCVILSGTPVQNKLKELWALYNLCCPVLLGDYKEFQEIYENPINAGNERTATPYQRKKANMQAKALRAKIQPCFLRRLKRDIFPTVRSRHNRQHIPGQPPPLPLKTDLVVWLTLSNRQTQVYEAFLQSETVQKVLYEEKGAHVLTAITILKKICDHPALLKEGSIEEIKEALEGKVGENQERLEDMHKHMTKLLDAPENLEDPMASCKLKFLIKLLKQLLSEGHRVLVFSQSKMMLDMTEKTLRKAGIRWLRIDGSVKLADRERRVQSFQAGGGADVFLLTSQVGGLGLTLHAADRVVVLDPAWNPSVDNQSVDRAYRLGQKRDVVVYRLITCETVEDKIYKRQVLKDGLIRSATAHQDNQLRYFNSSEASELLSLPEEGFTSDKTLRMMEEKHKGEVHLDEDMQQHLEYIKGLKSVIGVSHHDLLYTKEDDDIPEESDFHEGTEMRPVGTYTPSAHGSAGAPGTQSARKPLKPKSTNRTPQRAPGILQAAKAAAPLHVYAPAALQKAPVAPKPAVPTQAEISLAREQAKRADEDVAKLDIEILRMQNKLKQRADGDFAETLKARLAKKDEARKDAFDTATRMKQKYDEMVDKVPAPATQVPAKDDDDDDVVEVTPRPSAQGLVPGAKAQ